MSTDSSVVLVLGTGSRALYAASTLERQGREVGGLLSEDEKESHSVGELSVLGKCDWDEIEERWLDQDLSFFVAVSSNRLYVDLCLKLHNQLCNAIDPTAVLSSNIQVGRNLLVEAGAVLGPKICVENGCWIQPHARLAAGCHLKTGVIVGSSATISENVSIESGAHIGPHSYLAAGLHVGANAQIAPLSLVLKDVPTESISKGRTSYST